MRRHARHGRGGGPNHGRGHGRGGGPNRGRGRCHEYGQ